MEKFKTSFFFTFGSVYLSNALLSNEESKILHISDTPTVFYSALAKIINRLQPQYIIHTGDLVDNIKLNIYPNRIDEYESGVSSLLNILENSTAEKVFIALGNHDHLKTIESIANRSIIIKENRVIDIENTTVKLSHYYQDLIKSKAKYNFFGHDIAIKHQLKDNSTVFLNGIENINIITLNSGQIFTLPYPFGTNDARLGKFKIGI